MPIAPNTVSGPFRRRDFQAGFTDRRTIAGLFIMGLEPGVCAHTHILYQKLYNYVGPVSRKRAEAGSGFLLRIV